MPSDGVNVPLGTDWFLSKPSCRESNDAKEEVPPYKFCAMLLAADIHDDAVDRVRSIAGRIAQARAHSIQAAHLRSRSEGAATVTEAKRLRVHDDIKSSMQQRFSTHHTCSPAGTIVGLPSR